MVDLLVESKKAILSLEKYYDFVLRCEDREFRVPWLTICPKSTCSIAYSMVSLR